MRIVKYKKIGLENFCCYTSLLELEIENKKLVIITGKNGIGKTTLFESISFTLFGVTSKGLRANNVVNNRTKKNCHTYLEFSIDGNEYRIDRYYAHVKYKNTAIMTKNGQPYKKGSKEVTKEVERLLVSRKIFMNSMYFGQKVTFFTDLDDTERKDIFRKILKLDELVIYHKKCSKMLDELSNSIILNKNEISVNKKLLEDCKNQIDTLEREKIEFEKKRKKELDIYESKYNELELQFEKTEDMLIKYKQEYNSNISEHLTNLINNYNYKLRELEITFKNIVEQIKTKIQNKKISLEKQFESEKYQIYEDFNKLIQSNKDKYQHKIESIKINISDINGRVLLLNSTIQNNNREIDRLKKEKEKYIRNIFNSDISICPTCHQKVDEKTRKDLEEYIHEINKSVSKLNIENKNIKNKIEQLNNDIIKSNENISKIKKSTDKLVKKIEEETDKKVQKIDQMLLEAISKLKEIGIDTIQEKTQNLKDEKNKIVELLNSSHQKKNKIDLKLQELNKLDAEVSHLKYQKEKYEELIKQINTLKYNEDHLISYKTKCKDIEKKLDLFKNKENKMNRRHHILSIWKEAFSKSGIESMLIDESIPFMNKKVNEYLDILSFGRYVLSFDTVKQLNNKNEHRDKIDLNVLDNESLADSRDKLSAGQTRIIDIAIILTLCDLQSNTQGIRFNLLLLDEVFDNLDDENIIRVAELLRSLTRDRSIYIITHRHIDQIDADEELKL